MAKKNRYNLIQYNRAAVDYTPPEPFSASYGILTVIGRDGEPIPVNGYSDFFITHRQDGWDKVNFALPVDLEIYREITEETIVRYADNEYSVKKIKNGRIEGEINLGFLRGIYYEHYELTAKTLSYALSGILPTGWTAVGAVLIPGTITLSLEHSTGVDIVNALMSAFNVYFVWNCAHRTCTVISADTAEDRGQYMTDELNLKQVSYTGSTADFCTVLYCYGRDNESIESVNGGKKYIENHTYSAKRIVGVFTCDYYEPLHIMIAGVREMLRRCKPEQSYECDVVDLAKLSPTYSFLDFSLHQSATLIDRKRELNVKHRIVEYKEYPDEPERNVVTLSQSAPHYPEIVEKERKKLATEVSSVQRTAADAKVSAAQAQTSADEAKAVADDTKSSLSGYVKTNDLSASIDTYVDSSSGKARITSSLSGTYQTVEGMSGYVKTTQLSADIGAYIDTQAGTAKIVNAVSGTYATQDALGNYLQKTELSAGINTYIDTQAGTAKITAAVAGTYAEKTALGDYEKKVDLSADIGSYIDTQAGTAKLTAALEGTFAEKRAFEGYVKKTELSADIGAYIDTQTGKAKITAALSGTFVEGSELELYEKVSDMSADIGAYIDTQAGTAKVVSACSGTYQTKSGMSDYVTTTGLNTSIGQYLDTATGKAKIESAVSGTYQKKSDMGDYVETTELNTKIGQYIDGSTGTAKIVSACSGTYQTASGMSSYYTKTQVDSEISQSVSPVESAISLTAAYGSGTIGSNVRALLQLVANADRSTITINADKIDFSGFTTFLRASDLGLNGSTTIDGGRITTGEISADRIKVQKLYATYSSSMYPIAYANSSGLYIGHWDGSVGGTIDKTYVGGNHIYIGNTTTGEVEFNNSSKVFRPLSTTSNYTIGSSDYPFKAIYAKAFYLNGSQISGGIAETDVNKIYCASSTSNYIGLSSSKDFVASGTGFSLGSTSYPFDEFYCGSSSYYLKHSSAGIIPNTTSTSSSYFQLGSTSYPFNDLYVKNLHVSGSFDLSGSTVKMGGTSSYYIEANTSRELKPSSSSATYPAYLGTSSIYWHYAYIGSNTVMIGSSGTASGSKLGFFGTTAVVRQSLSLSSNNMSYSSVTASNYLYALNNLIGILKKHGLISA